MATFLKHDNQIPVNIELCTSLQPVDGVGGFGIRFYSGKSSTYWPFTDRPGRDRIFSAIMSKLSELKMVVIIS